MGYDDAWYKHDIYGFCTQDLTPEASFYMKLTITWRVRRILVRWLFLLASLVSRACLKSWTLEKRLPWPLNKLKPSTLLSEITIPLVEAKVMTLPAAMTAPLATPPSTQAPWHRLLASASTTRLRPLFTARVTVTATAECWNSITQCSADSSENIVLLAMRSAPSPQPIEGK